MVHRKVMLAGALALGGCSFQTQGGGGGAASDDGGIATADGAVVRPPDAAPAPDATPCLGFTFSPWLVASCDLPDPAGVDLMLTQNDDYDVDTDAGTVARSNGQEVALPAAGFVPQHTDGAPEVFVIAAADLTLGGNARLLVHGTRPLVLLATGTLRIDGEVRGDGNGLEPGGGADRTWCAAAGGNGAAGATEADADGDDATSGGGGGGLGSAGGAGGPVADPSAAGGDAAAGGMMIGGLEASLRGGCWGGDGGPAADGGGRGGAGGGGVALIAVQRIEVNGRVSASGGGGEGAASNSAGGGGGGGSGGMVWLIAPSIDVQGQLTANGGGGGEGGQDAGAPDDGADGRSSSADPAGGGSGRDGGDGGDGSGLIPTDQATAGGQCDLNDWNAPCGGGGGGGGAGYLYVRSPDVTVDNGAVVSPGLTNVP